MGAHHPGCAVVRMGDLRAWCDCRGNEMTEITKADLIAASALSHLNIIQPKDERIVAEYFAIHRKFGYGKGCMEERAATIAWLREERHDDDWGVWFAERIEAGGHVK